MKYNIRGQKIELTDSIKEYTEQKLGKLDKYLEKPNNITANVLFKIRGKQQIIEVTIPIKKLIIRCEESNDDLYASIDLVSDKLERQIRKNKTKMESKKVKFIPNDIILDFDSEKEEENIIVKRKTLEIKPMNEEEAILQMELIDHEFFIFINSDTDKPCVLYKRKDGEYGLIDIK